MSHSQRRSPTRCYWRPSDKNIHRRQGETEKDDWGVSPDEGYRRKLEESEMAELAVWRRNRDLFKPDGEEPSPEEGDDSYFDPQLELAIEYIEKQSKRPN